MAAATDLTNRPAGQQPLPAEIDAGVFLNPPGGGVCRAAALRGTPFPAVRTAVVTVHGSRPMALPPREYRYRFGCAVVATRAAVGHAFSTDGGPIDLDYVLDPAPALAGLTEERSPIAATGE